MITIIAMLLGIWAAFTIVGFVMTHYPNPTHRVRMWCGFMVIDLAAVIFAYNVFPDTVSVVFTFTFTKLLTWGIMNHQNMVFTQFPRETN